MGVLALEEGLFDQVFEGSDGLAGSREEVILLFRSLEHAQVLLAWRATLGKGGFEGIDDEGLAVLAKSRSSPDSVKFIRCFLVLDFWCNNICLII